MWCISLGLSHVEEAIQIRKRLFSRQTIDELEQNEVTVG